VLLAFEDRTSTSPFVERVWRCHSLKGGRFLSMAEGNIELVLTRLPQLTAVTLRGPSTYGEEIECPPNGEWLTIRFALGTHFPRLPAGALVDRSGINLPVQGKSHFWLSGLRWEIPSFDNAESFVERLALAGVIAREHSVGAVVDGDVDWMSRRSVQRRFVRTTGLTLSSFQQIARARHAATLLASGLTVLDATYEAGYFDQAHMTKAMRRLIGTTPGKLVRDRPQLSFSYKTAPPKVG
jgi:hypothetical protein